MGKQILNRREAIYAEEIPPEIVDTSGFIEATDYATDTTGGTVKVDDDYGVELTTAGFLRGTVETADDYAEASNNLLVSKGTLDAVLAAQPGGGSFSRTQIWTGDADFGTQGTHVTLSHDYDTYDALYLIFQNDTTKVLSPMLVFTADVPVAESATGNTFGTGVSTNTVNSVTLGGFWMSSKTQMEGVGGPAVHLIKVYGVNF